MEPLHLVDSESETNGNSDLMRVKYVRVQSDSPNFVTTYDSFGQTVDVEFTTFVVRAVPEHVLPLYDFIMSTFVPNRTDAVDTGAIKAIKEEAQDSDGKPDARVKEDKIRVRAQLASFRGETCSITA